MRSLTDIGRKVNMILQKYEPNTKARIDNKERDVSFLKRIKYHFLYYYLDRDTIVDLETFFECNKIGSILIKYSKEDGCPIRKPINEVDMLRNANETSLSSSSIPQK